MGGYSTTALLRHGGTSGSTPFAGGAAALIRNWHRKFNTFDPGQTYARLIVSGQQPYPYTERGGAGHLKLPACAASHWGKVSISPSVGGSATINIPIPVFGGMEDLDAAIWWPMSPFQAATDLDLYLIDPNGVERAKGFDEHSVFERIRVAGSLTLGTWTLKITGYTLLSSKTVYWTADVHGCVPLVVETGGIPEVSPGGS